MYNVLVTGKDGFIAKNLIEELKNKNYNVTAIDFNSKSKDLRSDTLDFLNENNFDGVFHVGACSDTLEKDANFMMIRNYESTKVYADWCDKHAKALIYSSSAASYGTNNLYPSNLYGWSKYVAEDYVIKSHGIGLRYFNVYGEGEEHKKNMSSIVYQMYIQHKKSKPVRLFPGSPKRDFIYVKDVVGANIYAYENFNELKGNAYDVGTGDARSFEDIMNCMNIPYEITDWSEVPNGYQFFTKANKEKFMRGWKTNYDLEAGLKSYLRYLKK